MAGSLKRGETRIYAQSFIVSGVKEGLSGNQILQNLRSAKIDGRSLGYRTETFYEDFNRYASAKRLPAQTRLAQLPENFSIDYAFRKPTRSGERWMYPLELTGTNRITNEPITLNVSFVSPTPIIDALLPNATEQFLSGLEIGNSFILNDFTMLEPQQFTETPQRFLEKRFL